MYQKNYQEIKFGQFDFPKIKEIQPPDLELDFLIDSGAE